MPLAVNVFCRLFGHTWWPETETPDLRWNTTKDGQTLVPTSGDQDVRHYEVCKRCGTERDVGARRHDGDRPADSGAAPDRESA